MTQFAASIDLSSLNGSNGFRLDGITLNSRSGNSVSSAGDINGDGYDDVIIGAKNANSSRGDTFIVFGRAGGFASSLALSSLDGSNGFVLNGESLALASGTSVSAAGDVNGDGFDDIIIGAPGASPNTTGRSYIVFGKAAPFAATVALANLDGTDGFKVNGVDTDDFSGRSVSSAGDVNGDGFDDFIIGAHSADPANNNLDAGEAYLVFGKAAGFGASLNLSSLTGNNGFRLDGVDNFSQTGFSVSSAGDVNGDGFDDILVAAPWANPTNSNLTSHGGETYLVFGKPAGFAATFDLSSLDGSNGFRFDGAHTSWFTGFSVSSAGDINGDGFDDIIVGTNVFSLQGESYVIFGKAAGFSASFGISSLGGNNGFVIPGIDNGDYSGSSVSAAGDVNGDGFDDILIGARTADGNGLALSGESYVIFGKASGFGISFSLASLDGSNGFKVNGLRGGDRSGQSVSSAGDVNGDGFADIIIGAPSANYIIPNNAGESYVVFGVKETATALNLTGAGGDQTMLGGTLGDTIAGLGGNDILKGFAGDDSLDGGDGDDVLLGGRGSDVENGGAGNDAIYGSNGNDTVNGGDGDDLLKGNNHNDTLDGGKGNDTLYGGAHHDTMSGGTGADRLYGGTGNDILNGNRGNDRLRGGDGNDHLSGQRNNDHIKGGAGDDIVDGGEGRDWLFGGTGADSFVFAATYGTDSIHDWQDGIDNIDLTAFGFTDFATEVLNHASQVGADLVLTFGSDVLTINNFLLADFDDSDVLLT